MLKKTEENPANPGSLCRDGSAWPQAEQGREASQGNSRDAFVSRVEDAGTYLTRSGQAPTSGSQPSRNHENDTVATFPHLLSSA